MSNGAHQIGHCKAKQQKSLHACQLGKQLATSETYLGFLIVIYDTSTDLFQAVLLT